MALEQRTRIRPFQGLAPSGASGAQKLGAKIGVPGMDVARRGPLAWSDRHSSRRCPLLRRRRGARVRGPAPAAVAVGRRGPGPRRYLQPAVHGSARGPNPDRDSTVGGARDRPQAARGRKASPRHDEAAGMARSATGQPPVPYLERPRQGDDPAPAPPRRGEPPGDSDGRPPRTPRLRLITGGSGAARAQAP